MNTVDDEDTDNVFVYYILFSIQKFFCILNNCACCAALLALNSAAHVALHFYFVYLFFLLFMFILHSREGELYRGLLNGMSALAWELPFLKCLSHLSFTQRWGRPVQCLAQRHNKQSCRLVLHNIP